MTSRSDLALVEGATPPPVASLSIDELKAEAVHLAISIEKGADVMREWRIRLGEVLTEIKTRLGHGNWLPYIRENLALEHAQVSNYLKLAESSNAVRNMPTGLSMREELKLLRGSRPARPVRIDVAAPDRPLLRFCGPDWSTSAIVKSIILVAFPGARMALDVTYGLGNFWSEGAPIPVTGHDRRAERAPDGVMDFTDLAYDDATWDVVCFDPSHLADGGEESEMADRFGTEQDQEAIDNAIIEGTREAWRVCSQGIIVKVCNHVHGETFQYEQALVEEALDWKIPYYDLVYQVRDHAFIDPIWGPQKSAYNNGAVYVILKKGSQLHR